MKCVIIWGRIMSIGWLTLSDEEKIPFQKRARDHIAKQQYMKECITDALLKDQGANCSRSYSSLVKATGDWCNRTTIVYIRSVFDQGWPKLID